MRTLIYILFLLADVALAVYWGRNDNMFLCGLFSAFSWVLLCELIINVVNFQLKKKQPPSEAEKLKQGLEALGYTDVRIEEKTEVHYKEPKIDLRQFLN